MRAIGSGGIRFHSPYGTIGCLQAGVFPVIENPFGEGSFNARGKLVRGRMIASKGNDRRPRNPYLANVINTTKLGDSANLASGSHEPQYFTPVPPSPQ